jgi:hypothetical protein
METSMRKLLKPTRRRFLAGGASLIAAPAIVKAQGILASRYPPGGYIAQAVNFPISLQAHLGAPLTGVSTVQMYINDVSDAEEGQFSPTGLAKPGPDGVSTVIVAARPCGAAAREKETERRPA